MKAYRNIVTKLACLVLLLILPVYAMASDAFPSGLLWKVESSKGSYGGQKPGFVFGTMHTEDQRVLSIPPAVRDALDSASSFTLEVKLDAQVALESVALMMLSDGKNLKSMLGDRLFKQASTLMLGYGMPEQILMGLKPWAVFVTLSTPKNNSGIFLDKVLYDEAMSQGKAVYGLETVKEQLSIFDEMPVKDQVALLQDTIKNHKKLPGIFEQMTRLYLNRDLQGLVKLNKKHMKQGNIQVTKKLMKKLVVDRNVRMVSRMEGQLHEGGAFIAVGALHLPGKNGILKLLQDKGYNITKVY